MLNYVSGGSKSKHKSVSLWQSATVENRKIFPQVLACEYVLICHKKCQVHISKTQKQQKHTGGFITVGISAVSALVCELKDKRNPAYSTS